MDKKSSSAPVGFVIRTALLGLLIVLAACSHQAPEYFWANANSGEYLFAFDTRECGERTRTARPAVHAQHATDLSSEAFFSCMQERGYALVDPKTGHLLTAKVANRPRTTFAPQAAR